MSDDLPIKGDPGRPEKVVNMEQLTKIMRFHPSILEAAYQLGVSEDTISRRIKEETGKTFEEFRAEHFASVVLSAKQKIIKSAQDGDEKANYYIVDRFGEFGNGKAGVQVNVQNNVSQNITVEKFDLEERIKQLLEAKDEPVAKE